MGRCFGPLFWRKRPGASPVACCLSSRSCDGGSRADAARLGGVGLQTIRDWVLRFNFRGPDGLVDGKSTGHPSKLNDEQRRALVAMVEAGPTPAVHGVVRWRLIDLAQWVFDEYRISVTKQILSRELRALGYRKLSARPRHHAHDEAAVAAFKKKSRTFWRRSPRPAASHSNSGSKTKPAWSEKQGHATLGGTRHATFCLEGSANRLRLYFRRHLSGARQGGRSRPPSCNTEAMTLHLQEIAVAVAPGAHAVLFVDRAGWHVTAKLGVPENITLVPLPSKSPELNPVENIWQYMRDNWLSNRIFANYNDILDHCCFNWNKLERPWLIMSIGTRRWAHG